MTLAYWGPPACHLQPLTPAGRGGRRGASFLLCPTCPTLSAVGKRALWTASASPGSRHPLTCGKAWSIPRSNSPSAAARRARANIPGGGWAQAAGSAGRGSLAGAQPHAVKSPLLPQRLACALPLLSLPEAQWLTQNCFKEWATWQLEKKKDTCRDDSEQGTPPFAVQWLVLDSTEGVAPVQVDGGAGRTAPTLEGRTPRRWGVSSWSQSSHCTPTPRKSKT